MKQVIFLCLLSLAMCLGKPAETQASTAPELKPEISSVKPSTAIPTHVETSSQKEASSQKPISSTIAVSSQGTTPTPHIELSTNAAAKEESAASKGKEGIEDHSVAPPKETSSVKPSSQQPQGNSVPAHTDVKPADNRVETSTKTTVVTSSVAPKVAPKDDEVQHIVQARGFDGPSFMGGIILTLGLLAIGFMGFKYYKNQTERNYHTL